MRTNALIYNPFIKDFTFGTIGSIAIHIGVIGLSILLASSSIVQNKPIIIDIGIQHASEKDEIIEPIKEAPKSKPENDINFQKQKEEATKFKGNIIEPPKNEVNEKSNEESKMASGPLAQEKTAPNGNRINREGGTTSALPSIPKVFEGNQSPFKVNRTQGESLGGNSLANNSNGSTQSIDRNYSSGYSGTNTSLADRQATGTAKIDRTSGSGYGKLGGTTSSDQNSGTKTIDRSTGNQLGSGLETQAAGSQQNARQPKAKAKAREYFNLDNSLVQSAINQMRGDVRTKNFCTIQYDKKIKFIITINSGDLVIDKRLDETSLTVSEDEARRITTDASLPKRCKELLTNENNLF